MRRFRREDAELSARDQALVVRLADGTLPAHELAGAHERLARIPGGAELVERQRCVVRALRLGLDAQPSASASATAGQARGRGRVRARVALAATATAALAALAAALVVTLGGQAPTVAEAVALTARPAEGPAPPPAQDGRLLAAQVDGVPFPDWSAEFGWHAVGARDDELDGRSTTTVFYEHMGHLIGYTIVSGPALEPPEGATHVRANGVDIALYSDGDRDVAVFVRDGHTCVLAGHVLERATLVKLAAWKGDGAIAF